MLLITRPTYLVRVSSEEVYMVPPTSMCTGAVYLEAAATHGIPVILLQFTAGGVGDDEFDIVGDVAGELLGDISLKIEKSSIGD